MGCCETKQEAYADLGIDTTKKDGVELATGKNPHTNTTTSTTTAGGAGGAGGVEDQTVGDVTVTDAVLVADGGNNNNNNNNHNSDELPSTTTDSHRQPTTIPSPIQHENKNIQSTQQEQQQEHHPVITISLPSPPSPPRSRRQHQQQLQQQQQQQDQEGGGVVVDEMGEESGGGAEAGVNAQEQKGDITRQPSERGPDVVPRSRMAAFNASERDKEREETRRWVRSLSPRPNEPPFDPNDEIAFPKPTMFNASVAPRTAEEATQLQKEAKIAQRLAAQLAFRKMMAGSQ